MENYNVGKQLFIQTMLAFDGQECIVGSPNIVIEMGMGLSTYIRVNQNAGCVEFVSHLSSVISSAVTEGVTQGVIAHTDIKYPIELYPDEVDTNAFTCLNTLMIPLARVYYTQVKSLQVKEGCIVLNDTLKIRFMA